MERRLNFEGMISHLFLKAKQPNDQIGKNTMHTLHKNYKEMNLLALAGIKMESFYDRNHRFNKNTIIWATPWENVSSGVSDQARHKPACAATEAS